MTHFLQRFTRNTDEIARKIFSDARMDALQSKVRSNKRLGILLDRLALWDVTAQPVRTDGYIVWRSKYGPRRHLLKLPTSHLGRRMWNTETLADAKSCVSLSAVSVGLIRELQDFAPEVSLSPCDLSSWQEALESDHPDLFFIVLSELMLCLQSNYEAIFSFLLRARDVCEEQGIQLVLWVNENTPCDAELARLNGRWIVLAQRQVDADRFAAINAQFSVHAIGFAYVQDEVPCLRSESFSFRLLGTSESASEWVDALAKEAPALGVVLDDQMRADCAIVLDDNLTESQLRQLGRDAADGAHLLAISRPREPWLSCAPFIEAADVAAAATAMNSLNSSPEEAARSSLRSMRFANEFLGRRQVLQRITVHAGAPAVVSSLPLVSVICVSNRIELTSGIIRNFRLQSYPHRELIIVFNADSVPDSILQQSAADERVVVLRTDSQYSLGESLNRARAVASGELWTKMDDDDHYGANYLRDMVYAQRRTAADIVGKGTFYSYRHQQHDLYLSRQQPELAFSERFLHGGTILADSKAVENISFSPVKRGTDSIFLQECKLGGLRIYSSDRFNFAYIRYSAPGHHTFDVSTEETLRDATLVAEGVEPSFVDV